MINYPTEPSNEISNTFWASTANSIGNLFNTSLLNHLRLKQSLFLLEFLLVAIKNLVFANFTGCRFVFNFCCRVFTFYIWESIGATIIPHKCSESHWEKFLAFSALALTAPNLYNCCWIFLLKFFRNNR